MLITPNVIRNRSEGTAITDDFRSKLSTLRNELERMERDRARSQPKLVPPEIPPPSVQPKESEEKPPFAPSRFVPQRGASVTPDQTHVTVLSNVGPVHTTSQPQSPMVESGAKSLGDNQHSDTLMAPSPTPSSAYSLSLGRHQAAAPVPVLRPSSARQNEPKQSRQWAVQVAALADRKDADAMVVGLRKNGYEAYVMTVQTESKTWHRVRVGQFPDVASAKQLRQSLVNALPFKGAYVAAN